jgi:hypothetical protein
MMIMHLIIFNTLTLYIYYQDILVHKMWILNDYFSRINDISQSKVKNNFPLVLKVLN